MHRWRIARPRRGNLEKARAIAKGRTAIRRAVSHRRRQWEALTQTSITGMSSCRNRLIELEEQWEPSNNVMVVRRYFAVIICGESDIGLHASAGDAHERYCRAGIIGRGFRR